MSNEPDFIDDFDFGFEFAIVTRSAVPLNKRSRKSESIRWSRNLMFFWLRYEKAFRSTATARTLMSTKV